jgi:UDP-galactopyranose mutase
MTIAFAGAGLSCAVIARELSEHGYKCEIYEQRSHIAGNCFTKRDDETNILVHEYGPHIFHTNDDEVWKYINKFSKFHTYVNRVKAQTNGLIFSLPINLHTINQFYGMNLNPEEAKSFISKISDKTINVPKNFEEQALKFVGRELYEAFFKKYTQKQWGRHPSEIPAEILKRLPIRFNYDDNYFSHTHQGMPINGYTNLVENLLDHSLITVHLNAKLQRINMPSFTHVFYSGPLDEYFNYEYGVLPYRTLDFSKQKAQGDFQGCAVMNYCDESVAYTRIAEHKHFSPWESHEATVYVKEFSREFRVGDIPYYPVHLAGDNKIADQYLTMAAKQKKVSFVGRLGTFRYLDMDQTIRSSLDISKAWLKGLGA